MVLGGIASRLRDLMKVRALPDRMPPAELARAAGLRFDWQARRYQQQARNYSHGPADRVARTRWSRPTGRMKSGASADVVMPTLVAAIAARSRRSVATRQKPSADLVRGFGQAGLPARRGALVDDASWMRPCPARERSRAPEPGAASASPCRGGARTFLVEVLSALLDGLVALGALLVLDCCA